MIIRISGGIGNQMFQYAFKQQLDYIANCKNTIDIRFFENRNVHNGYELNKVFDTTEALKPLAKCIRLSTVVCIE